MPCLMMLLCSASMEAFSAGRRQDEYWSALETGSAILIGQIGSLRVNLVVNWNSKEVRIHLLIPLKAPYQDFAGCMSR